MFRYPSDGGGQGFATHRGLEFGLSAPVRTGFGRDPGRHSSTTDSDRPSSGWTSVEPAILYRHRTCDRRGRHYRPVYRYTHQVLWDRPGRRGGFDEPASRCQDDSTSGIDGQDRCGEVDGAVWNGRSD